MKRVHVIDQKTLGGTLSNRSNEALNRAYPPPAHVAWQPGPGVYLAAVGVNSYALRIHDRQGDLADIVNLTSACAQLAWSPDGSILGIAQTQGAALLLWRAASRSESAVETNMRGFLCLAWSRTGAVVAAGTAKGNLLLHHVAQNRSVPVLGKHERAITGMAWTRNDTLVTVSDDRSFSVSTPDGDTVFHQTLKSAPRDLRLLSLVMPDDPNGRPHTVAAMAVEGGKNVYLHSLTAPTSAAPIEFALQLKYGPVVALAPVPLHLSGGSSAPASNGGDAPILAGRLAVACANGYVIFLSLQAKDLGQEVAGARPFKGNPLTAVAFSAGDEPGLSMALASGGIVKVIDVAQSPDLREIAYTVNVDDGDADVSAPVERVAWSADRRFLTVCKGGDVMTYVSSVSAVAATNGDITASVSGLNEVSLNGGNGAAVRKLTVGGEPQLMAMTRTHIAAAWGSTAAVYDLAELQLRVTHAAAGPVLAMDLHPAHLYVVTAKDMAVVRVPAAQPANAKSIAALPAPITSEVLATLGRPALLSAAHPQLLVATHGTTISVYAPPARRCIDYDLHKPITQLVAGPQSPLLLVDTGSAAGCLIVNPAQGTEVSVPAGMGNRYLWDTALPNVLYAWTDGGSGNGGAAGGDGGVDRRESLTTLVYLPQTLTGPPAVVAACSVPLPANWTPAHVTRGTVTCVAPGGRTLAFTARDGSLLANYYLGDTAKVVGAVARMRQQQVQQQQGATQLSLMDARQVAQLVDACLQSLDLATAAHVLQLAGEPARAAYLLACAQGDTEAAVLRGHVLVYLNDITGAQEMYLRSRQPRRALDLRRDLLQWEQALALAAKVATPAEEVELSRAYAVSLEAEARYADALVMYNRAREGCVPGSRTERVCAFGAARMRLRVGDFKALRTVVELNDMGLMADAGAILEEMREYADAAALFERAGKWDRAAANYLRVKNLGKLAKVMAKLAAGAAPSSGTAAGSGTGASSAASSPSLASLWSEYGTQLEAAGQVEPALDAFTRARDAVQATRLLLSLSRIDEAVAMVRSTRSREAARLVADFFARMGNAAAVIEFYVLADMRSEAQARARDAGLVHVYLDLLGDDISHEDLLAAALYYEQRKDALRAGQYYMRAGHHEAAVAHLLRCGDAREALDLAIECVGRARSDALTHEVVAHLMTGTSAAAKDPRYIFRLYMSLGQVREAARTALIIARDEWANGNYRPARDVLHETAAQMRAVKCHVPAQMRHMLMLLHSYMLVKVLIRADDHLGGARMLVRVSRNISRFPAHVVPILTSTVLECLRTGLKGSAAEFAAVLMRPENRGRVDAKYKKKIETLVRKQQEDDRDPVEETSPCVYCGMALAVTELDCPSCRNTLPFCVASGYHMTLLDWSQCPSCASPGLLPAMQALAAKSPECPMCSAQWSPAALAHVPDPRAALAAWMGAAESEADAAAAGSPTAATAGAGSSLS
ncbi:hypothetical protein H9P43_009950 [Blastocladiella emersonii ATCC 22665]|nr:hypothetical protein H9P43_009950 [Blastocladiella emersonii ATCC 22665]